MTASTQCVRPAVQSFSLDGSYWVVRPGTSRVQPMKGGSSARVAAGAISSAAATAATTTERDTIVPPELPRVLLSIPGRATRSTLQSVRGARLVSPSAYRVARTEQDGRT